MKVPRKTGVAPSRNTTEEWRNRFSCSFMATVMRPRISALDLNQNSPAVVIDTCPVPVDQLNIQHLFQLGQLLRYRRLRQPDPVRSLRY